MGGRSIAIALAALALSAAPASGGTVVVDQVLGPYTTITDGIHAAAPGDTVEVHPGLYDEQLWIDKDDLTVQSTAGAAVSSTAAQVVSLMGARDTVRGLAIAGGPSGVRIEGDDATLEDVTVTADETGVAVNGGLGATLRRTFVRATALAGAALRARNLAPADQQVVLDNSVLVGGRLGTAMDLSTGQTGDSAQVGGLRATLLHATVAGAPTALRMARAGLGGPVQATAISSIVHGSAAGLIGAPNDLTTPDDATFRDAAALDFRLLENAPGIDQGVVSPGESPRDITGAPRVSGAGSDLGAYELVPGPASPEAAATPPALGGAGAASASIAASAPDKLRPALRITSPRAAARLHRYRTVRRKGGKSRRVVNVLRFGGRAQDAGGVARLELSLRRLGGPAGGPTCTFLDPATRRIATRACARPPLVRAALAGDSWTWRTSPKIAVPLGRWTLTARATDRAGNVSTSVLHFTVT
jgi:hypothetical protein